MHLAHHNHISEMLWAEVGPGVGLGEGQRVVEGRDRGVGGGGRRDRGVRGRGGTEGVGGGTEGG